MAPRFYSYGTDTGDKTPLAQTSEDNELHEVGALDISHHAQQRRKVQASKNPIMERFLIIASFCVVALIVLTVLVPSQKIGSRNTVMPVGPYKLASCQEGQHFFENYDFYDGPDSIGSAGYNTYISEKKAKELGIANVTLEEKSSTDGTSSGGGGGGGQDELFIYMKSASTDEGPRDSIRLEGKQRYDRGLFILDLRHMPFGCGVWPAWWLTDEENWPKNGEIDIVEGINYQSVAKTALHTSDRCQMYAHVPNFKKTGEWDWATGIPNQWTGIPDFNTSKEADDCNTMAPHQWANQGCVAVSTEEGSLGGAVNANGGGVYALEWDPYHERAIRSWTFSSHSIVPSNLKDAIETASKSDPTQRVMPDPNEWGLPYGYFAVGNGTGCTANHLKNMRIVFNLAFCGTVAGNRYFKDCPNEAKLFRAENDDPVQSCNAWIKSNPNALDEAYWKIKGLYVYEREMVVPATNGVDDYADDALE